MEITLPWHNQVNIIQRINKYSGTSACFFSSGYVNCLWLIELPAVAYASFFYVNIGAVILKFFCFLAEGSQGWTVEIENLTVIQTRI